MLEWKIWRSWSWIDSLNKRSIIRNRINWANKNPWPKIVIADEHTETMEWKCKVVKVDGQTKNLHYLTNWLRKCRFLWEYANSMIEWHHSYWKSCQIKWVYLEASIMVSEIEMNVALLSQARWYNGINHLSASLVIPSQ